MTATASSPELVADFVDEALESLRQLPGHLAAFRQSPQNPDPINAVFRAVHSIKGCAGFLGLNAIKVFAHGLENTMDDVRKEKTPLTEDLERSLVQGFDLLDELLQRAADGRGGEELDEREQELLDKIRSHTTGGPAEVEDAPDVALIAALTWAAEAMDARSDSSEASEWGQLLRAVLQTMPSTSKTTSPSEKPPSAGAPPKLPAPAEVATATFRVGNDDVTARVKPLLDMFLAADAKTYTAAHGQAFLRHAEEFSAWAKSLGNEPLSAAVTAAIGDLRTLLNSPLDIDAMLLSIVWERMAPELVKLRVESSASAGPSTADKKSTTAKSRMLRIKEERIDEFLDDVSRLFITGELLKDLHSRMSQSRQLSALVEELKQINQAFIAQSTKLQQSVVALRRVAVSGLFAKYPQMARSLASQLGKQIDVQLSGEETEVDKSVVEDLDAPLTHMIRNVADHAIESPEERLAVGKPEHGTLWIKAETTRSHVVITVRDDGKGIDPAVLRRKAVEKGIITQAQADAMTDQQAIDLIFHAGFSTAKQVSDVSGRGVGMDVVRTTLRAHNGEVYVSSQVGIGTTFRLEIPIREAVVVIDGLMIRQNGESFVVPFEHIREIAQVGPDELKPVQGAKVAILRDRTYDAISLADLLRLPEANRQPRADGLQFAVHVGAKNGDVCLLVDDIAGHRQVVVNKFEDLGAGNEKVAGVAQLGGGRLALVLSVPDIVDGLLKSAARSR